MQIPGFPYIYREIDKPAFNQMLITFSFID